MINKKLLRIITIGRISPVKDYETLIKAANILKKKNEEIKIKGIDTILFFITK